MASLIRRSSISMFVRMPDLVVYPSRTMDCGRTWERDGPRTKAQELGTGSYSDLKDALIRTSCRRRGWPARKTRAARGGAWADDGTIVFSPTANPGQMLLRVSEEIDPMFSPDGRWI